METYYSVVFFMLGAIFGSFFNVCIFRIPEKESIVNPPSHCYKCNTRLKPLDLVPIFSWVFLKGKCRYCKTKVSSRYAIVELITGILFLMIYKKIGIEINTIYYLILISLLVIITFIDLDHYIIPDELIIIGSVISILFNVFGYGVGLKGSLLGGLICGGGMLVLIQIIEFFAKTEVMGGGDIKLFGMIGLFLGIKLGLLTIFLSIYVGAIYGIIIIVVSKIKKIKHNSMIPYGPFISIAAILSILYGDVIIKFYMNLF